MKRNSKIIIFLMIIGILTTIGVAFSLQIFIQKYENEFFKIEYDTTWKVLDKKEKLVLEHKTSKGILNIQNKKLEINFLDIPLKDIVSDIVYSIEKQNTDYKLINVGDSPSEKYESFSYLYENGNEQVLVNIYKKDNVLIVVYYQSNSEYYDIVLDSVDTILDSLEIISGEKVNWRQFTFLFWQHIFCMHIMY